MNHFKAKDKDILICASGSCTSHPGWLDCHCVCAEHHDYVRRYWFEWIFCGTDLNGFFVVLAPLCHSDFGLFAYVSIQNAMQNLCSAWNKHVTCAHSEPLENFAAQHKNMDMATMTTSKAHEQWDKLLDNWRWQHASEQLHTVCVVHNTKSAQLCQHKRCMPTDPPAKPKVPKLALSFAPLNAFSVCSQLHQHPATHADWVAAVKQNKKQERAALATATYLAIALGWQLQQSHTDWKL